MNRFWKIVLATVVAIGCLTTAGTASAHWHGTVGVWIGPGPYWWGPSYYPYYYPPPVVVADPVYMQPSPGVQLPAPQTFWYFCRQSNTYYPYVNECPSGWEQVAPRPPGPTAAPQAAPR